MLRALRRAARIYMEINFLNMAEAKCQRLSIEMNLHYFVIGENCVRRLQFIFPFFTFFTFINLSINRIMQMENDNEHERGFSGGS